MRKKCTLWIAALALAALLSGCSGGGEAPAEEPPEVHTLGVGLPESEAQPMALRLAGQVKHPALMTCLYGENFYPERIVTRGELSRILADMLVGLPEGTAEFSDIRPGSMGYAEAAALADAGIARMCLCKVLAAEVPYNALDRIRFMLGQEGIEPDEISYALNVTIQLTLPVPQAETIRDRIMTITARQAEILELDEGFYPVRQLQEAE